MTDSGSAAFEAAYASARPHEGGYQCDPADDGNWTGGKVGVGELKGTKYGISAASYPALDIKNLSVDDAKDIYWRDWWLKFGFGRLDSPRVGAKLFDAAINMGVKEAVICLQRASRAYGKPLLEDGNLGPVTIAAVNAVIPYNFLPAFRSELAAHYRLVVARNPSKERYQSDWLGRAYA